MECEVSYLAVGAPVRVGDTLWQFLAQPVTVEATPEDLLCIRLHAAKIDWESGDLLAVVARVDSIFPITTTTTGGMT